MLTEGKRTRGLDELVVRGFKGSSRYLLGYAYKTVKYAMCVIPVVTYRERGGIGYAASIQESLL